MKYLLLLFLPFCLLGTELNPAVNPLKPIRLDNPRDTMASFLSAMNDYREGLKTKNQAKLQRLSDATRCLQLQETKFGLIDEVDSQAAIFLKEVIDRVIVVDTEKIPIANEDGSPLLRWRLRNTEIDIVLIEDGRNRGKYLFSRDTALRAQEYFRKVEKFPYLAGSGQGAGYKRPWSPTQLPAWARRTYLILPAWQWGGIFLAILVGFIIKTIVQHLAHTFGRITAKTKTQWDDRIIESIEGPIGLFAAALFWFYAIHLLGFDGGVQRTLTYLATTVTGIAFIAAAYRLVDVFTDYLKTVTDKTDSMLDDQMVPLLKKALRVFVVVMGILLLAQNLGIQVMSVLAGLGLGGLAFALAAKDTCANLFGSIMILIDRPFQIGDWVIIGDTEGTVEEIGFRSTRVRTFYNSLISVPNSVLANANVDNMGRREYRRIKTLLGLTYDTPAEKVEAFTEGVKNIIKANPYTRKDYYHVVFNSYGDCSLNILLYCFLKVPDWANELVERQKIFLEILRLAEELGVDFAFPTQSLHIESFPEKEGLRKPHHIDAKLLSEQAAAFGVGGAKAKPGGHGIFVPPFKEQ